MQLPDKVARELRATIRAPNAFHAHKIFAPKQRMI
jgi:hypothetical protein